MSLTHLSSVNARYALQALVLSMLAVLAEPEVGRAQSAAEPLTLQQVERLIEAGVTNNRIISLAARNKLAFRVDPEAERRLRAAGADSELVEALRGIRMAEPGGGDDAQQEESAGPDSGAPSAPRDSIRLPVPRGPALSATGAALLSIPLPGVPLMTRPSPGPLIGVGIVGALGYLAWDFYQFREDREALREWAGAGEPPLNMTMEQADSVSESKASRLLGVYLGQVLVTYLLWDELTPHPATIQPFVAADPQAMRLNAGVRVRLPDRLATRWVH